MEEKRDLQFNRLSISAKDFQEAEEFLATLSSNQCEIVQRGLLVAAIVVYSRPFTNHNAGATQRATRTIQTNILKALNQQEKELHRKILDLRNTAVAHSEFDRKPTSRVPFEGRGVLIRSKPFNPLSEGIGVKMFGKMAKALGSYCVTKMIELNKDLGVECQDIVDTF